MPGLQLHPSAAQGAGESRSELYPRHLGQPVGPGAQPRLQVGPRHPAQGGVRHDVRRHHRTDRQPGPPLRGQPGPDRRDHRGRGDSASGGHEPGQGPLLQEHGGQLRPHCRRLQGHPRGRGAQGPGRRGGRDLHQILPPGQQQSGGVSPVRGGRAGGPRPDRLHHLQDLQPRGGREHLRRQVGEEKGVPSAQGLRGEVPAGHDRRHEEAAASALPAPSRISAA